MIRSVWASVILFDFVIIIIIIIIIQTYDTQLFQPLFAAKY